MFFFFTWLMILSWLGRRLVGDQSPTDRRPVASSRKEVPTRSPTSRRSVGNQSPISRRPTAKPSCDSSATSAIVLNFSRGEVAERLQCMSDLGLTHPQQQDLTRQVNLPKFERLLPRRAWTLIFRSDPIYVDMILVQSHSSVRFSSVRIFLQCIWSTPRGVNMHKCRIKKYTYCADKRRNN